VAIVKMKYKIFLFGTILVPVLLVSIFAAKLITIERTLVKKSGVISQFKKLTGGARSDRSDSFELENYTATFSRQYGGFSRVVVPDKSHDIFEPPPADAIDDIYYLHPVLKASEQRKVTFYIPAIYVDRLQNKGATVPFINLKFNYEQTFVTSYYLDIYWYMYRQIGGGIYTVISLLLITFCAMGAAGGYQHNKLFVSYLVFIAVVHILIFMF
jgi:hypothetical protein